jgi:hypothetical protein
MSPAHIAILGKPPSTSTTVEYGGVGSGNLPVIPNMHLTNRLNTIALLATIDPDP